MHLKKNDFGYQTKLQTVFDTKLNGWLLTGSGKEAGSNMYVDVEILSNISA